MGNLRASLLMVGAMAGFAVEDAIIKYLSAVMPVGQIVLVIGAGGGAVFCLLAWMNGLRIVSPQALRGAVLLRNLSEMVSAAAVVLAIALIPLAVVTAILQAMPLAVTLGAALFLREPVGWRRWSAILVGFLGVLIILRPGSAEFDPAALLALAAVLSLTARDLATRRVPKTVHSLQLTAWGFLMVIPAGILLLLLVFQPPVPPTTGQWGWLLAAIGAGICAYAALVGATRMGDIAVTTPFRYSRLVFATAIGVVVFGERPDAATLIGSALVVGAGLFTLWREMRLRPAVAVAGG
jgi:drug/metabolite transporter (DMT)-like permease